MQFRFSARDFGLFCALFVIEVVIALFVRDRFIRPIMGDVLVVILIFYFVRAFVDAPVRWVGLGVLIFAFCIEFAQYFKMVEVLGLQDVTIARIVLGTTYSTWDLLAYLCGATIVVWWEQKREAGQGGPG